MNEFQDVVFDWPLNGRSNCHNL